MKQIKHYLLAVTLFLSASVFAQNPTRFTQIQLTNNQKQNNSTRVMVQDSVTGTCGWVLKNGLTVPDATTISKGKVQLAGDLGGTASSPTVPGLAGKESLSNKNVANGYAGLDSGGKVNISQLPASIMEYQGVYNASTNTPTLIDGTGNTGDVYRCSVAGSGVNGLGFIVGDYAIYDGSVWQKSHSGADNVVTVFGRAGVVTATSGDYTSAQITETTNKNFQTDNQKLYNDATSSIQTQINSKANTSTTLNINGVSQDLSANRTWTTGMADTGVLTFTGLTTNSSTTINIGAVVGVIVDNETNPLIPVPTKVNYAGATGVTVTTIGSGTASYVMLSSAGVISFQNTFPTPTDRKSKIWLGKVSHPAGAVTIVLNEPDYITSPMAFARDWFQDLGPYVNNGIYPSANGANLNVNISAGTITGDGINFVANRTDPNHIAMGPNVAATFTYRTQTGGSTTGVTVVDPTHYDVSGTVTAIPGGAGQATIEYWFTIPGAGYIVQYGQTIYSNFNNAVAAVGKESFVRWSNLMGNAQPIAALVVTKGCTDLTSTAQAQFFLANKNGDFFGATSGVSTATGQSVYNNSSIPQVTTSTANGAMTWRNGQASDTSIVCQIQNIAGATTSSIDGNGNNTANSFVKSGATTTDALLAGGNTLAFPASLTINQTFSGVSTFNDGKLGFRNTANTFTSFFTNANTASRTYTLKDRNGTLIDDTDYNTLNTALGTKQSVFTGVANYIAKSINSTTLGVSRLFDDGTFFGLGTVNAPTKDITLGNQSSRSIGVEQSVYTVNGTDLIIESGRATNFAITANLTPANQIFNLWLYMGSCSNGSVYAIGGGNNGVIYRQTYGSLIFTAIDTVRAWTGIAGSFTNNDMYACENITAGSGNIYKQTNGVGAFASVGGTARNWTNITIATNGDVYACVSGGDIYRQAGGVGTFNAMGQSALAWYRLGACLNGDIYACVFNGDIYKLSFATYGDNNFHALGQTSRPWTGITGSRFTNDMYATIGSGDIYRQTNATGNFGVFGQTSRSYQCITSDTLGSIYVGVTNSDIYFMQPSGQGIPDLNGGTLINQAGTAKGTGQSRWQVWTGQKTVTGTDMQVSTKRIETDENGKTSFFGVIRLNGYTVSTLPTGSVGDTAYVTDALTPTYMTTVVGGGAIVTKVFYDGVSWKVD